MDLQKDKQWECSLEYSTGKLWETQWASETAKQRARMTDTTKGKRSGVTLVKHSATHWVTTWAHWLRLQWDLPSSQTLEGPLDTLWEMQSDTPWGTQ